MRIQNVCFLCFWRHFQSRSLTNRGWLHRPGPARNRQYFHDILTALIRQIKLIYIYVHDIDFRYRYATLGLYSFFSFDKARGRERALILAVLFLRLHGEVYLHRVVIYIGCFLNCRQNLERMLFFFCFFFGRRVVVSGSRLLTTVKASRWTGYLFGGEGGGEGSSGCCVGIRCSLCHAPCLCTLYTRYRVIAVTFPGTCMQQRCHAAVLISQAVSNSPRWWSGNGIQLHIR